MEKGILRKEYLKFENNMSRCVFGKGFVKEGDVILVKGSRGMKMEEIVNKLTS